MFTESQNKVKVVPVRLTKRELEILRYIAYGHKSQDIADILIISKRTVDFHIAGVFSKLGVCNRISAIRVATKYGFLINGNSL